MDKPRSPLLDEFNRQFAVVHAYSNAIHSLFGEEVNKELVKCLDLWNESLESLYSVCLTRKRF